MKNILFTCLALPALLFSCSKDKEPTEMCSNTIEDYDTLTFFTLPSTVGTYWVYDKFKVDSLGVSTPYSDPDTVTIIGDTLVDGLIYQIYENSHFISSGISLRRLSNGTVYNEEGTQIYSITVFNEEFNLNAEEVPQNEFLNRHSIMVDKRDEVVAVPYGDFNCLDREIRHFYDGFPVLNACGDTQVKYHLYLADGIGEVKQSVAFFPTTFETCEILERRLIEFYEP